METTATHEPEHESEHHRHPHLVRVHIDQKQHESPSPTTGTALYALAGLNPGFALFREVRGDHEDPLVKDSPEPVHLKEDEHFHSGPEPVREYHIVVNARPKHVNHAVLTFDEIVVLAFGSLPPEATVACTVQFSKAARPRREGSLVRGQTVHIENGTNINVTQTNKS